MLLLLRATVLPLKAAILLRPASQLMSLLTVAGRRTLGKLPMAGLRILSLLLRLRSRKHRIRTLRKTPPHFRRWAALLFQGSRYSGGDSGGDPNASDGQGLVIVQSGQGFNLM
jgi:hypothetical protein